MDEFAFGEKVDRVMVRMRQEIGAAMKGLDDPKLSMKTIKDGTVSMVRTMMESLESTVSLVSDMASATSSMRRDLRQKDSVIEGLKEQIKDLEKSRDVMVKSKETVEMNVSRKEMEEKIRTAMCQVKILDIDIGKETEERKEMVAGGIGWIREKVRNDLKEEFDLSIKRATVAPLGRRTVRRDAGDGKVVHGVPILITLPDRVGKWNMEDLLRKSKVYPAFHWPAEVMEFISKLRGQVINDMGVKESESYIRIRPEDRGGRLLIRADVKPKNGNGKFLHKASWELPPLDKELWGKNKDLFKPTLAK